MMIETGEGFREMIVIHREKGEERQREKERGREI